MAATATKPLAHHRVLSPTASIKVSPICLGAMNFGDVWKDQMGECDKETSFAILDYFHSQGGNHIDTANLYMGGESELWLGEWLASRKVRDQMVIATKYTNPVPSTATDPKAILSNYSGANRKSLRSSLEESLKRLQTDYIDIFYVHAWDPLTSIPELMHSLHSVVLSGKVLYLGVSNWPAWGVVKANEYARRNALMPFVVYEGRWNPAERAIERDIVPMCKAEGMAITVWSALGGGKFSVKKRSDGGRNYSDEFLGTASVAEYQKFAPVMEQIGNSKGSDATAVALRYCMLKAPYVFPIIGGRSVATLKRNIEALKLDLTAEEIEKVEAASPFDFGYPHSLNSGDRYKQLASGYAPPYIMSSAPFDGVGEVQVRAPFAYKKTRLADAQQPIHTVH